MISRFGLVSTFLLALVGAAAAQPITRPPMPAQPEQAAAPPPMIQLMTMMGVLPILPAVPASRKPTISEEGLWLRHSPMLWRGV